MLTERDISIVRQASIKASARLVGDALPHMEPGQRARVTQNRESISKYVIDLAKDFEEMINKGICITTPEGVKPAPKEEQVSPDSINLIVKRGEGKGEKYSTYPYYFFFVKDHGFEWNDDRKGYIGQLTEKQLQDMKESDEEIEITLGKVNKRQVKFKVKEIMTKLLKVEEE